MDAQPKVAFTTNGAISNTMTQGVILVKSIYVINGYQIEVVKTITTSGPGLYHINIVATNNGTASTSPSNVFIYDIVPAAFYSGVGTSPKNIQLNGVTSSPSQQALTGSPADQAFYWNMSIMTAGSRQTVAFDLVGNGSYNVENLYVVGVDPAQSVNSQTSPMLNNMIVVNANFEWLAAFGALALVVVGMFGAYRRRF